VSRLEIGTAKQHTGLLDILRGSPPTPSTFYAAQSKVGQSPASPCTSKFALPPLRPPPLPTQKNMYYLPILPPQTASQTSPCHTVPHNTAFNPIHLHNGSHTRLQAHDSSHSLSCTPKRPHTQTPHTMCHALPTSSAYEQPLALPQAPHTHTMHMSSHASALYQRTHTNAHTNAHTIAQPCAHREL
jgi:hypothetical protein